MAKSTHSKDYGEFLGLLKLVREEAGLTQVQLGAKLKMDQSNVSKCERGERRLDVIELWRWTNACGVKLRQFAARLESIIG